jgi:phenylacetaldehyde dehydrogenase
MAKVQLSPAVEQFLRQQPFKNLISGRWVPAKSGHVFNVYDPGTGGQIARVAESDAADIDAAVKAARRAFEAGPWRKMTPSERTKLIWKLAELIDKNADQLAEIESLDNGKPKMIAKFVDVVLASDLFRYMAGWATKIEGATIPISVPFAPGAKFHAYTTREPIGVVGQIIPWNFPLLMAAWKLGPALAAGCTIVLKPAEQTPLSAIRLGELITEAGFPDGVVNIVNGYGETAGAALVAHPDVDKVAFTGSTEVGRMIVKAAAGNLKKVSLELGGKSPNIIFPDADLDKAVPGAANAIFFNHGQCCTAGSRLFVHKSVYDDVVEGVAAAAAKIRLGHGLDPATEMGPLVSQEQHNRVCGYLKAGLSEGAKAVTGGKARGGEGYFVHPTVFANVKPGMKIAQEEIFGPVVAAIPFNNLEEIAAAANNTIYGLAAGIWTRDVARAHDLASKLKAGSVWVNCYNVLDAALPFGGFKQSGWGREMGKEALELYTEVKSVCVAL